MVDYIECSDCGIIDDVDAMQWIIDTGETFCEDCKMSLVVDSHGQACWA